MIVIMTLFEHFMRHGVLRLILFILWWASYPFLCGTYGPFGGLSIKGYFYEERISSFKELTSSREDEVSSDDLSISFPGILFNSLYAEE